MLNIRTYGSDWCKLTIKIFDINHQDLHFHIYFTKPPPFEKKKVVLQFNFFLQTFKNVVIMSLLESVQSVIKLTLCLKFFPIIQKSDFSYYYPSVLPGESLNYVAEIFIWCDLSLQLINYATFFSIWFKSKRYFIIWYDMIKSHKNLCLCMFSNYIFSSFLVFQNVWRRQNYSLLSP